MVEVKEKRIFDGYDCWGRPEYEKYYVVKNEEGVIIYEGKKDPTYLIQELKKNK